MIHIGLQTNKSLDEVNKILMEHGFEDFFNTPYDKEKDAIYVVSASTPLTFDDDNVKHTPLKEILQHLKDEYDVDSGEEFKSLCRQEGIKLYE